jgi:hypothetical protein
MQTTALGAFRLIDEALSFGPILKNGLMDIPRYLGLGYARVELFERRSK